MGCPITWKSKIQTEIDLSTTEAEHVALIPALHEVVPMIEMSREISAVMDVSECRKKMKFSVFEDKTGALELAKTPTMRPRTKHTAIKRHRFRNFADKGTKILELIGTSEKNRFSN